MLEVTESRLRQDPLAPLDILTRLRLKRVGLSIDDFGTGHSSLTQLRDFPFDEMKIDRSFVHGCAGDTTRRAILLGSLGMAHELGMRVVAEGVDPCSLQPLRIRLARPGHGPVTLCEPSARAAAVAIRSNRRSTP